MAFIDSISITAPADTDDPGDFPAEHRADKAALLNTFPNIDGEVTATEDDLNTTDVATLGTAEASKVVTADANIDVTGIRNLTMTGTLADATLTGATLTSPVLNGTLSGTAFLDEDTMSSDSAIAAASQQSIKAYVDTAVSGLSSGKLLDFAFETTSADANCTTSWQTRDTVTLTNVQSGSTVLLFAFGQYFHPSTGAYAGHLDITDSSNNGLLAGGEFAAASFPSSAANTYVTITAIGRDSSPSVGSNTYNFRYKATSINVDLLNSTIVALEIGA